MRISSNLEPDILAGIQQSKANLQTALQQVSTGQRVNLPGDDPTAAAIMVQNTVDSNNVDQYTKNVSATLGASQTADSVITSVVSLLTQAVTLGTQGGNSTNSPTNEQSLAIQVRGILSSVVSLANTTYQGVSIFAGTKTGTAAFVADSSSATGYTYAGNSGVNQVQVGDALDVQVNVAGNTIFTNANASALGALTDLANALDNGSVADVANATASVTNALSLVSAQHSVFGNSINELNTQESFLGQEKITLSSQASNLIGIDTATAAENLAQAETHNSAVLAAAAKALPTTLLDYLK